MDRLDHVLREINEIRAEYDQPPLDKIPCGCPGDPKQCPIARALSFDDHQAIVTREIWMHRNGFGWHEMPSALAEFVVAFDGDEFPELIES